MAGVGRAIQQLHPVRVASLAEQGEGRLVLGMGLGAHFERGHGRLGSQLAGTGSALGPPHLVRRWLVTSRQRVIIGMATGVLAALFPILGPGFFTHGAALPSAPWQAALAGAGLWPSPSSAWTGRAAIRARAAAIIRGRIE